MLGLEVEQQPLGRQAARVAGEPAAGTQHPVARHDDQHRVAGHRRAHGARAVVDEPELGGESAVGGGLAVPDARQGVQDAPVRRPYPGQVDRDGELAQLAGEVGGQLAAGQVQPGRRARPRRAGWSAGWCAACSGSVRRPRRPGSAGRAGWRTSWCACPSEPRTGCVGCGSRQYAAPVRLGVNVPNFGPGTDPGVLRSWARTVEGLGYDLLMVSDHVAITPDVAEQYPAPFYEPFTTLAWLAGVTERVRLGHHRADRAVPASAAGGPDGRQPQPAQRRPAGARRGRRLGAAGVRGARRRVRAGAAG